MPRGAEPDLFALKVLGELVAVAEVLRRPADLPDGLRGRVHALLLFAWRELEEGEVLARFLEQRAHPLSSSQPRRWIRPVRARLHS